MKMCIISVEPMPSMISMPVASLNAWRVASGSASPAETQRVNDERPNFEASAAMLRYITGAAKHTVALKRSIVSSSVSAVCFSTSTTEAPTRIGKHSVPPSPKVKATGGVPTKMSSLCALRIERGKRSHIATTSRWKCIVPLGLPVVPEVNAISATSSAAVGTLVNHSGCFITSESSEFGLSSYQYLVSFNEEQTSCAALSSSSSLLSQSA